MGPTDLFTKREVAGVMVVHARGSINHLNYPLLRDALSWHLGEGNRYVVLDLSDCDYIDSAALSILLRAARALRDDGLLALIAPKRKLRRILSAVGLLEQPPIKLFQDTEAAASFVREHRYHIAPS